MIIHSGVSLRVPRMLPIYSIPQLLPSRRSFAHTNEYIGLVMFHFAEVFATTATPFPATPFLKTSLVLSPISPPGNEGIVGPEFIDHPRVIEHGVWGFE